MSRAAKVLALSSLLLIAGGCKTSGSTRVYGNPNVAEPTGVSLISQLRATGAEMAPMPVVLPSDVWKQVSDAGGDEETSLLLEKFLTNLFVGQDRRLVNAVVMAALGPQLGSAALLTDSAGPATKQEIAVLSRTVFMIIKSNPALLDTIAAVDPAKLPPLQMAIFQTGQGSGSTAGLRPFGVPTATAPVVDLTNEGCSIPQADFKPIAVTRAGTVVTGRMVVAEGVSPCFHQNSAALATQLNLLANNLLAGEQVDVELRLAGGTPTRVRTYEGLLAAVQAAGYTIELFSTRVFVEFRAFAWKQGDNLSSIRMTTWMRANSADQPQPVPAEHGEVGFVIHKGGRRLAQVRWYGGLPDDAYPGQSAWWRPHPELSAPWAGVTHEIIEVYPPGKDLAPAKDWFVAAAHGMLGYQAINQAYKPPHNSYGILVCTDSLAVHMAKLGDLRRTSQRLTDAFPLVRGQFVVRPGDGTTLDSFFETQAQMPQGNLASVYPADTLVARDGAKWRARVTQAYPLSSDVSGRYRHFPEFIATLEAMSDQ